MRVTAVLVPAVLAVLIAACTHPQDPPPVMMGGAPPYPAPMVSAQPAPVEEGAVAARPRSAGTAARDASPARAPRTPIYPWLSDPTLAVAAPADSIEARFAPPQGFERVEVAAGSFAAWLRRLPLAPPGTSVLSFRGDVILPSDHENLAAVVAIDIGDQDLQQCADSVIRLHAEWLWSQGRRDMSYRAAAGTDMPWERWARGDRVVARGKSFGWKASGKPVEGHAAFRRYLDAVFAWANTGSLARDTQVVAVAALAPGDFVVQPGSPGHAVLVLDLAQAPDGRRAVLLGQGFMPAQSFQVLRPSRQGAWFVIEPGSEALATPFWAPFPWKALRRFDRG
jgi:hypothetical protein